MNNEPRAGMSLDAEMLAAYIDKRLTPEQRAVVEAQLASDPDSYAVLVETLKALDEVPDTRQAPQPSTAPAVPEQKPRRWVIAAGVLAAAAAIVLVVLVQPDLLQRLRGERVDPQLQALVAAVGEERYLEGRLSGGFKFGPMRSVTRGAASDQNLSLMAASAAAQNAAADGARSLRVSGVARLLVGDTDGGITALEESARLEVSAATLADLSAGYLARAAANDDDRDLRRALDAAQRAVALAPDNSEALYNRALAAERLQMPEALGYWETAIANTPVPGWREEAQRRMSALRNRQQ
jgi:tetratricopeptide (TPR) repeat protein